MLLSPTIPKMENNFHVRLCGFISTTKILLHMAEGLLYPLEEKKNCDCFLTFPLHYILHFHQLMLPSLISDLSAFYRTSSL